MSYNIVENGELKNIAGPSGGIVEGKPIYGERKQYDTNKKMPLAGQAALKYTIDRDGILTGSCHKAGQGYSAWMRMNGKTLITFDNYGGESCSFDFPNVRVKAGDVIELTTNVPTTETTNFFWLNNIGVTPIVGVEPSIELQAQDTYSLEEIKVGTWIDGKPIYRKVFIIPESNWAVASTFSPLNIDFDFSDKTFIQASGSICRTDGFEHQISSYYSTLAVRHRKTNPFEIWCNQWGTTTSLLARVYLIVEYTKNTD